MTILRNYKFIRFIPFGDGEYSAIYSLVLLQSFLFGLVKRKKIIYYELPMFADIKQTEKYWDNLIANKTNL